MHRDAKLKGHVMTINEYQKEALRTLNKSLASSEIVEEGLMGLNGEAGEAIDILKKHLFQGHSLNTEHLAKELGDIAWYLAITANALGYDLETILQMNIEKLKDRYPNGFHVKDSLHRQVNDI